MDLTGAWSAEETAKRLPVYMKGFFEHFNVESVQVKVIDPPTPTESFRYLVFEDFGTSGLTGNPAQWWPEEHGNPNPFFNYFRAEGISDKTEGARGRHGVGRLVFMFASRVRSIFGLTRRGSGADSEELLMGTAVLRNHRLNGDPYLPDGWFGVRDEEVAGLTLPVRNDAAFIGQFKSDFSVSRQDDNGLSVIVPWLSRHVTDNEVVKAVLLGYFYPILRRELFVEVMTESGVLHTVNADTIDSIVAAQFGEFGLQLKPIIALARSSLTATKPVVLAAPAGNAPKWDAANIHEEARQAIHDRLEAGDLVAIRAPMNVRLKGQPAAHCYFDVFLQRDSDFGEGQIHFIREGIIITDVRPRRTSGIRALVVIDEGPLASFLGDSENPSHTQWQAELVRDKYSFHRATIEYVVQSVPQILSIISQQQKKPDTSLLIDLFSLPAQDGIKTRQKKQKRKDGGETETETELPDIPKTLRRFAIDKRANGFVVRRGDEGAIRPPQLAIKVAYGVRRGSPFAKYNPADFRLGLGGIQCTPVGCEIADFDENWMLLRINEDDFELAVTGFDTSHRDLHVDVKIKGEGADVEQAPEQQEVAHAATT